MVKYISTYINVDKKFVAGVYKENNLMETLFPNYKVRVGTARQTRNFTVECRNAFGVLKESGHLIWNGKRKKK